MSDLDLSQCDLYALKNQIAQNEVCVRHSSNGCFKSAITEAS